MKKKEKYTLKKHPPEILESKMMQYKDFNQVIKAYQALPKPGKGNSILRQFVYGFLSALILSVGIVLLYTQDKSNIANQEQEQAKEEVKHLGDSLDTRKNEPPLEALLPAETLTSPSQEIKHPTQISEKPPVSPKDFNKYPGAYKPQQNLPQAQHGKQHYTEAEPLVGYDSLYRFLSENLRYPTEALNDSLEGIVRIRFLVTTQGNIEQIEILQSLSNAHDQEAFKVIQNMPPWKPAQLNGKPISSRIIIPLSFKIKQ